MGEGNAMILSWGEIKPVAFPLRPCGPPPPFDGEVSSNYSAACFSGSVPGGLFDGFQRRIGLRAASVSSRRRRGA